MEEQKSTPSKNMDFTQMSSTLQARQQEMKDEGQYYYKTVLTNLQNHEVKNYITSEKWKQKLGYPMPCLNNQPYESANEHPIGIAYSITPKLFKFVLCNSESLLFEYQAQANEQKQGPKYQLDAASKHQIAKLIKGNILVGHDLGAFLVHTQLTHNDFIDTLALYPHHFGLPFKNTLQNIALQQLSNYHSQYTLLQRTSNIKLKRCSKLSIGTYKWEEVHRRRSKPKNQLFNQTPLS